MTRKFQMALMAAMILAFSTVAYADVPECDSWNRYSCDESDPCELAGNGVCEQKVCMDYIGFSFDDRADCSGELGLEELIDECGADDYTEYICDESDPCGLSGDGNCDSISCLGLFSFSFDDKGDCFDENNPDEEIESESSDEPEKGGDNDDLDNIEPDSEAKAGEDDDSGSGCGF
jgi:hypothetical protein